MVEVRCPVCGRNFIPAPQHVFVDNRGAYCKPTCWLYRNDNVKKEYKGLRRERKVLKFDKSGRLVGAYDSLVEAARSVNCSAPSIGYACRQGRESRGYVWRYAEEK